MDDPQTEAEAIEQAKPINGAEMRKVGQKWLERIQQSQGREKHWRDAADKATLAYTGEEASNGTSNRLTFNILHSNVETIVPAIYNSTPAPDVRRRFRDDDETARNLARVIERAIAVQVDDSQLDVEVEALAQDSYVAGRGPLRVRIEVDGDRQKLSYEAVSWRDYAEGPAKRWKQVPWVAFRVTLTKEGSDGIANKAYLDSQTGSEDYKYEGEARDDVDIWEIWCKSSRKVYFVRASDGVLLKEEDDPLGLPEFFPCPEPVQPITINGRRMPVCPYEIYRELAEEMDTLTKRIRGIAKGLKVRGATVDGEAFGGIEKWAAADDNEIISIRGVEVFAQSGGLDKAISWWPIEQAVNTLRELIALREQTKQAIYEITGISDIVRGASNSQETATAQQIKTQWGSLRIKKMQRGIERLVKEIFGISADLIATHFTPETLQSVTGMQITPEMAALLTDKVQRLYRVDVESDSTVKGDVSRVQGEMTGYMQGLAQFIQAVGPAVQTGQMPKEVAMEWLASFARTFNLGRQAEDALEKWLESARQQAQQPQPPDPAQQAAMQAQQMQMQADVETKAHGARKARADADKAEFELQMMHAQTSIPPPQETIEPPPPDPAIAEERKASNTIDVKMLDQQLERERMAIDLEVKREELKLKAIEASAAREAKASNDQMQVQAQSSDKTGAMLEQIAAMQERLIEAQSALTAPRRVVRDPQTNRVVGVEIVMPEQEANIQ